MKWIYRLLTFAMLGGAMLLPFFMNNNEGEPMFSLPETKDLIPSGLSSENTNSVLPSSSQTFYKWQDENGTWHYGDTPPPNGPKVSTIEVDSNANVIQSFSAPPPKKEVKSTPTPSAIDTESDNPLNNVLSFERAANVLNDAKKVQGLMDNHNAQLEAISGNNTK